MLPSSRPSFGPRDWLTLDLVSTPALVAVLKAHGTASLTVAENACRAIASLASKSGALGNTAGAANVLQCGGLAAIVAALGAHGGGTGERAALGKYAGRACYYLSCEADDALDGGKEAFGAQAAASQER